MSKKTSLQSAMSQLDVKPEPELIIKEIKPKTPTKKESSPPLSREGKKPIQGFFPPEVRKQLKTLAIERDQNNQALIAEALNLLFMKHKKPPIA